MSSKYYVVWNGRKPGVYSSWSECQTQITGFTGARYKSYSTEADAYRAFHQAAPGRNSGAGLKKQSLPLRPDPHSICVDAACSGNPGIMEYRGVDTRENKQIFRGGPYPVGTNNIGEFLAIVHGLAWLKQKGDALTLIYSDSNTALGWVKKKKCNTKLPEGSGTALLFEHIERAENWLKSNTYTNPLRKWETEIWGEIPADFGRKGG